MEQMTERSERVRFLLYFNERIQIVQSFLVKYFVSQAQRK